MAFSEHERMRVAQIVERYIQTRRPVTNLRPTLDIKYRIKGQAIEFYEILQAWKGDTIENAIAKTRYVRSRKLWKLFWRRADLKWHKYQPHPELDTLEEVLAVVDCDEYGCFFG
jgi:hypothetical protein